MAAPDAAQVADGINPFARFGAVWAACITPAGRKLVLLALTDFADADGTNIRPAVATVAARCNISAKQARRHIHDLVELGVIKTTRVAAQHRAATYALDFAALSALPQAGALENASTPMGVPQTSHPWETTPVITRVTTRVITGGWPLPGPGWRPARPGPGLIRWTQPLPKSGRSGAGGWLRSALLFLNEPPSWMA
ncbi:MAG: helix-turn-helix domain-containing protein [Rhodoferax sp.]|nr:helix-turn-helix domain-containing protein [Rhodoferax sp.]